MAANTVSEFRKENAHDKHNCGSIAIISDVICEEVGRVEKPNEKKTDAQSHFLNDSTDHINNVQPENTRHLACTSGDDIPENNIDNINSVQLVDTNDSITKVQTNKLEITTPMKHIVRDDSSDSRVHTCTCKTYLLFKWASMVSATFVVVVLIGIIIKQTIPYNLTNHSTCANAFV